MLQQETGTPNALVEWTDAGTAFQIYDTDELSVHILPKYFNLTKFKSFQRQLNYFGFRKWTKTMAQVCTFSHPSFQRDAVEAMAKIKRKKRQDRQLGSAASSYEPSDPRASSEGVLFRSDASMGWLFSAPQLSQTVSLNDVIVADVDNFDPLNTIFP